MDRRIKIILIFSLIAILTLVTGLLSSNAISSVAEDFNTIAEISVPQNKALEDLRFSGIKLIAATKGMIKAGSESEKLQEGKERREAIELFKKSMTTYENLVDTSAPVDRETAQQIRDAGEELQAASTNIIAVKEGQLPEGTVLEGERFEQSAQSYLKTVNRALNERGAETVTDKVAFDQSISQTKSALYFITTVTIILTLLGGFLLGHSTQHTIEQNAKQSK